MLTGQTDKSVLLPILTSLLGIAVSANLYLLYSARRLGGDSASLLSTGAISLALLLVAATFTSQRRVRAGESIRKPEKGADEDRDFSAQHCWDQAFDMISDPVSIHDKNFTIVKVNNALCEFLGKEREELIGRPCYRVFHNTEEPVEECPHVKSIESGQPVAAEITVPGAGRRLHIICSPLYDKNGRIIGTAHLTRLAGDLPRPALNGEKTNLIAVCASCKNIRDNEDNWMKIEEYLPRQCGASCTHSICPACQQKLYPLFTP